MLMDQESVKERWKEYAEDLYRKNENIKAPFTETEFPKEAGILPCEVEAAIKDIADNKSPGDDDLPFELFKELGDSTTPILTKLYNQIWNQVSWPITGKKSVYNSLPKKG